MTSIPYDEAKEIIGSALADMYASGKHDCKYKLVDPRVKCQGFGVRAVLIKGKRLCVCINCLKVMLTINPNLKPAGLEDKYVPLEQS